MKKKHKTYSFLYIPACQLFARSLLQLAAMRLKASRHLLCISHDLALPRLRQAFKLTTKIHCARTGTEILEFFGCSCLHGSTGLACISGSCSCRDTHRTGGTSTIFAASCCGHGFASAAAAPDITTISCCCSTTHPLLLRRNRQLPQHSLLLILQNLLLPDASPNFKTALFHDRRFASDASTSVPGGGKHENTLSPFTYGEASSPP